MDLGEGAGGVHPPEGHFYYVFLKIVSMFRVYVVVHPLLKMVHPPENNPGSALTLLTRSVLESFAKTRAVKCNSLGVIKCNTSKAQRNMCTKKCSKV